APTSLMTYAEAFPQAANIKFMTQIHQMPPWKPVSGCGDFADARVLSQDQIDTLAKWVDNGAPEGNASDAPAALKVDGGGAVRPPDLVPLHPPHTTPPAH